MRPKRPKQLSVAANIRLTILMEGVEGNALNQRGPSAILNDDYYYYSVEQAVEQHQI